MTRVTLMDGSMEYNRLNGPLRASVAVVCLVMMVSTGAAHFSEDFSNLGSVEMDAGDYDPSDNSIVLRGHYTFDHGTDLDDWYVDNDGCSFGISGGELDIYCGDGDEIVFAPPPGGDYYSVEVSATAEGDYLTKDSSPYADGKYWMSNHFGMWNFADSGNPSFARFIGWEEDDLADERWRLIEREHHEDWDESSWVDPTYPLDVVGSSFTLNYNWPGDSDWYLDHSKWTGATHWNIWGDDWPAFVVCGGWPDSRDYPCTYSYADASLPELHTPYDSPGTVTSDAALTTSVPIHGAVLEADYSAGWATDVSFEMSSGGTWESVTEGEPHRFSDTGTALYWQSELSTSDRWDTPELEQVDISVTPHVAAEDPDDGEEIYYDGSVDLWAYVVHPMGDDIETTFYDASDGSQLSTTHATSTDSWVSDTWSGLEPDETYHWYAETCTAGTDHCINSDTYQFETPPYPETTNDHDDVWDNEAQEILLECEANGADCDQIEWRLWDDGDTLLIPGEGDRVVESGTETTVTIGEEHTGNLYLEYRGVYAGVEEEWNEQRVRIDKTPPETGLPADDTWYNKDIQQSVDDHDPGYSDLDYCEYRVDDGGTGWTDWTGRDCGSVTVNVPEECSVEGSDQCTVEARATDNAGNSDTDTASYNIDLTPPATENDYDHGDAWQDEEQSIGFDCDDRPGDDNAGCDSTEYCVYQEDESQCDLDVDGEIGDAMTVSEDGTNYVRYRSNDSAGNTEDANEQIVRIDTIDPESTIDSPDEGTWHNDDITASITFEHDGPSNEQCRYSIEDDGAEVTDSTISCGADQVEISVPEECETEGDKRCELILESEDEAGNTGTDSSGYGIDLSDPGINCDWESDECHRPDPVIIENSITFYPVLNDDLSGINHTHICRDEDCIDEPYCDYPASEDSCSYTTTFTHEYPYGPYEYCIHTSDNAGNTNTLCDNHFPVMAGIGDPCDEDQDCGIGTCEDNICIADDILPPDILIR